MSTPIKTILSCIQPTGDMHLGNYFGAVKNYVDLQSQYDCHYGIVDYHAITMPTDYKKLRNNTWDLVTNLVAVGVKEENIFVQSLIPEHAELGWIFNCFCSFGRLKLMTQFKDKSQDSKTKSKDSFISAGLFDYPVLQAADILIYKADAVPVGDDQDQHLELTREIAQRFNTLVGKEYFVLPQTIHTQTPRIKSTADPTRKMSKSAGEKHYINVFGEENRIRKQIKSAVTDAGDTPEGEMSIGVSNLFEILKASGAQDAHDSLMDDHTAGSLKYVDLKEAVANAVVDIVTPFQHKKEELKQEKRALKDRIKASSMEIRKKAQQTVSEVKDLTGLLNVKF